MRCFLWVGASRPPRGDNPSYKVASYSSENKAAPCRRGSAIHAGTRAAFALLWAHVACRLAVCWRCVDCQQGRTTSRDTCRIGFCWHVHCMVWLHRPPTSGQTSALTSITAANHELQIRRVTCSPIQRALSSLRRSFSTGAFPSLSFTQACFTGPSTTAEQSSPSPQPIAIISSALQEGGRKKEAPNSPPRTPHPSPPQPSQSPPSQTHPRT